MSSIQWKLFASFEWAIHRFQMLSTNRGTSWRFELFLYYFKKRSSENVTKLIFSRSARMFWPGAKRTIIMHEKLRLSRSIISDTKAEKDIRRVFTFSVDQTSNHMQSASTLFLAKKWTFLKAYIKLDQMQTVKGMLVKKFTAKRTS